MNKLTTVIIADNTEEFCTGLSSALQQAGGFQILGTATDGEQAIRLVSERKPDVLVLDLMLPKRDGISVLEPVFQFHTALDHRAGRPPSAAEAPRRGSCLCVSGHRGSNGHALAGFSE